MRFFTVITVEETGVEAIRIQNISKFLEQRPYKEKTAFGFVTLLDPRQRIKETVFTERSKMACLGLDEGEKLALDYLIEGRYYSSTGTRLFIILLYLIVGLPNQKIRLHL